MEQGNLERRRFVVYAAAVIAALLVGSSWLGDPGSSPSPPELSFADRGSAPSGPVADQGDDVVVHVTGQVRHPGVYRLPFGSRVTDAVDRAGGAGPDGDPDLINLAARLSDGQQVVVPASAAATAASSGPAAATATAVVDPAAPISLGSATALDLEQIDGIGPVTAAAIIEFRDSNGGIASIEQLDAVSGIGPTTLESLRNRLQP